MLATYTVTSLADVVDPSDGSLTLREAIELGDTTPLEDDEIRFAVSGTIALELGELRPNDGVAIRGGGQITIQGDNASIFIIGLGSDDYVLEGLTLENGFGRDGGAIRSKTTGNLEIRNSILRNNGVRQYAQKAGGVSAMGDVVIHDSVFDGNRGYQSGAVFSSGSVTLVNSTVHQSETEYEAVVAYGDITLTASTVSDNSGGDGNGGVLAYGDLYIVNSTISGNRGGGSTYGAVQWHLATQRSRVVPLRTTTPLVALAVWE